MSAAGACSQNQKNRPKPKESDLRRKIIILAALFTLGGSESVREVRVEGSVVFRAPES